MNISLPEKILEKEVSFERNGIMYELHRNFVGFSKKKHFRYWENLIRKSWTENHYIDVDGARVRVLPPTINAVYVFLHLFFHLMHEGVALRQFCDWAMVLHHYSADIDRNSLTETLSMLGMIEAYKAFGSILTDELGLSEEDFPTAITEEDRKWKKKILSDIFKGGNFGKLNHHARSVWKYKIETLKLTVRNSFRYYRLAPSELGSMVWERTGVNLRLLASG